MQMHEAVTETMTTHPLRVRLAKSAEDLFAAQRLRYRVFIEEMGGSGPLVDHVQKIEQDAFDPVFDHLLLVDDRRNPKDGDHVVGVYRLLPDTKLAETGRFYCDDEFDLTPLRQSGRRLLELGRSCIDPAIRGGIGMLQMWQGLAEYVIRNKIEILFGAASFHGADPDLWAQPLGWLHHYHRAPEALRVRAHDPAGYSPLPRDALDRKIALTQMPPLIRAYLRLGGVVGDGVFVDPAFKTTDVCIILDTASMSYQARALSRNASDSGGRG